MQSWLSWSRKPEDSARCLAQCSIPTRSVHTVQEAQWLEAEGCDAVIAQGLEAGGHRGMFLAKDVASQVGTLALTPQIVDAVEIPVIAAGGIGDARGIVAAFALGASAVQIGTAYLRCPESRASAVHRKALEQAREDQTARDECHYGKAGARHC